MLEEESKGLADRLVRGQVSRAEEEETTFVVQRELAVLRHAHLETTHQLELAQEQIRSLSLLLEENVSTSDLLQKEVLKSSITQSITFLNVCKINSTTLD